jgi:hypothetical protein
MLWGDFDAVLSRAPCQYMYLEIQSSNFEIPTSGFPEIVMPTQYNGILAKNIAVKAHVRSTNIFFTGF